MRVLLIKTSSMGDIIHTLPALTDAGKAIPDIQFDWVVEESFAEIPHWHSLVDEVIPVALRRWRKGIFSQPTRLEWRHLRQQLKANHYDLILDAQGLVKSAFLTFFSEGKRVGLDWSSAREPLASLAYQRKYSVNFYQHAIVRMRSLFSQALGYTHDAAALDFGLNKKIFHHAHQENYLVFLHGTTWVTKLWPEMYWQQLATIAATAGFRIKISGGNDEEVARAKRIAEQNEFVDVMPRLSILEMAKLLANAKGAVAVDTGFGHLAAALNIPTISLYGSTNSDYTGALGQSSLHLATQFACSPCLSRTCTYREQREVTPACYTSLKPDRVWAAIQKMLTDPLHHS